MRLSENRPLAWIVLAACALGSVVGLGGAGLARERDKVERVFYSGVDAETTTRSSMDAYLDRAAECVQVMASELQLQLGEDNPTAGEMQNLLDAFEAENLDARYDAYTQLQRLSDAAYNAMYAAELTDAQRVNFKRAYDDFWGCDKYVRIDPYRAMASEFNASLSEFPASAVADLIGVGELNSFGA